MKRSQINALITEAKAFLEARRFHLPPWAFWSPGQWQGRPEAAEVVERMLGWDLTDFGGGDFGRRGLLLFTLRNGTLGGPKPYAEKIMIVREEQETPWHFHWHKTEDIINRGGGDLVMTLCHATADEALATAPGEVSVDGIRRAFAPRAPLVLGPGESVTLPPRLYHRFYGRPGRGPVLVGEVSAVNDDTHDNRFLEAAGRFPEIEEDTEPIHLLVGDYLRYR